jgi:hypothetical protein
VLELLRRILATRLRRALAGATFAGGTDLAKQELDINVFHSRTHLDLTEVAGAAGTGAVLGAVAPGHRKTRRVRVSENATWHPAEHKLGAGDLPAYGDGSTYGRLEIGSQTYYLKSGTGEPGLSARTDPDIRAGAVTPSHAEGHASMVMRISGEKEGTLVINNPNGPCRFCLRVVDNILPEGSTLTVVWSDGLETHNRTYVGNAK